MPDFERCIRILELHLEKDPVKREFTRQYNTEGQTRRDVAKEIE